MRTTRLKIAWWNVSTQIWLSEKKWAFLFFTLKMNAVFFSFYAKIFKAWCEIDLFISHFWLTTYKHARCSLAHCLYTTCLHIELDEWKIEIFYVEPGSFKTTSTNTDHVELCSLKARPHLSHLTQTNNYKKWKKSHNVLFLSYEYVRELKNCKDIKVKTLCGLASVAPLPCNNVPSQSIVWTKVWPDNASRVTVTFFSSHC